MCLHAKQFSVFTSSARFRILVAGRRFGKTELAFAELVRAAISRPHQNIWYVAPEQKQARAIAWERLKELTQRYWAPARSAINEQRQTIHLANGSTITLQGAFRYQTRRGFGLDFIVIDESASIKPEAWRQVFRPALADRRGRALLIGTPQGRNHFFDFFEYAQTNPAEWAAFQFTSEEGGVVDKDELASVARELDPNTYRQEFMAEFGSVGKYRVYQQFDRAIHVREVNYDESHPVIWTIDFNVDPMISLLMQLVGDNIHVFEELIDKPNATTQRLCDLFHKRMMSTYNCLPYTPGLIHVRIFGDASGHQRRTSGSDTDWAIIRNSFNDWAGNYEPHFFPNKTNPSVRDRVNCVNARLMSQSGEARIIVNPRCKELIRDLEEVSWEIDRTGRPINELNKSDRTRTHASDALGYFVHDMFPMKPHIFQTNRRLFW